MFDLKEMKPKAFHKKSTKELKEIIEGAGIGSDNWVRGTQELNSRMDLKAKISLLISVGALVIAGLSWWSPKNPAESRSTPQMQEIQAQSQVEQKKE